VNGNLCCNKDAHVDAGNVRFVTDLGRPTERTFNRHLPGPIPAHFPGAVCAPRDAPEVGVETRRDRPRAGQSGSEVGGLMLGSGVGRRGVSVRRAGARISPRPNRPGT
jgi:hypothetical protein